MPTTLKHQISYPSGPQAPNVPLVMQTQAESVDAALTAVANKMRHAEYTSTAVTSVAGTQRDLGAYSVAAGSTFNNTFATPDAAGKIKITEAGVYAVDFVIVPATTPGTISGTIAGNTVTHIAQDIGGNYGAWEITVSASNVYLPANEILQFSLTCNNPVSFTSRIRITKLHG